MIGRWCCDSIALTGYLTGESFDRAGNWKDQVVNFMKVGLKVRTRIMIERN